MDKTKLLSDLNDQQLAAIINVDGPCLIIAGAGVGKTRVLTYKIAYLIAVLNIPSDRILALTFTNKAAREMKLRVHNLLANPDLKITISTYHALCAKILRKSSHFLNINNNFNIIDQEDKRKILKDIFHNEFQHKADVAELRLTASHVSQWKNEQATTATLLVDYENEPAWKLRVQVYDRYQQYQLLNSCLDFDDLLLLVHRLFHQFPEVLTRWQESFNFILVDEFQDTNDIQYQILRALADKHHNLTVVGDPDQTIYTWRGANIDLILNFTKKYPQAQTFILNQNYRSTMKILNTANSLIKNNVNRIAKDLFTTNGAGNDVVVYHAHSSNEEAQFVALTMKKMHLKYHIPFSDMTILYRNNYLSKDLEQALINNNISYKIFGGYKFFERKEIKDLLAYLKVIAWNDNLSMMRILSFTPKIGPKAIATFLAMASEHNLSLSECLYEFQNNLAKNYRHQLQPLIIVIHELQQMVPNITSLHEFVTQLLAKTHFLQNLKDNFETDRVENVQQLLAQLLEFDTNKQISGQELLTTFLQEVSLYTDLDEDNISDKTVNLMTIHNAKGLEFNVVFVVGLSEGILPSYNKFNIDNDSKIEEERRLFYVAITRAKKWLFLSHADGFSYVLNTSKQPSRFLKDLPLQNLKIISNNHQELAENYRHRQPSKFNFYNRSEPKIANSNNSGSDNISNNKWQVGDVIIHDIFGKGVIVRLIGDKMQVAFHQNKGGMRIVSANHSAIKRFV